MSGSVSVRHWKTACSSSNYYCGLHISPATQSTAFEKSSTVQKQHLSFTQEGVEHKNVLNYLKRGEKS